VREANRSPGTTVGRADLTEMLDVLALANLLDAEVREPPPVAETLLREREHAREARDFASADAIRDELKALGWEVRDGPEGPELIPSDPS
jgi:cysteinyl-tRNA synthetase